MSELLKTPEPQSSAAQETSPQVEKKTPNKRGRMSYIERAQKESEELVKNMGGSLELEGGRRTRSSTRGTPSRPAAVTPPPVKKARNSPASPKSTPRARGRGRKLETTVTPEPPEEKHGKEKGETLETASPTAESVDTPEASEEKPETNGPEKSIEDDQVKETVLEKSKKVEVPKSKTVENEEVTKKDRKEIDQVDSALDSVQEQHEEQKEKTHDTTESVKSKEVAQNQPSLETDASAGNVDSPMDVDEQSGTQDSAVEQQDNDKSNSVQNPVIDDNAVAVTIEAQSEANVEPVAETVTVDKQPTPEPMEVDSSSKSSDVVECSDVVDKAETVGITAQLESTSSADQVVEKSVSGVVNDSSPAAEKNAEALTKSKTEENGTTGEANAKAVTENDISAAPVAAIKTVDATAVPEEPKTDSLIESKTENNIDETKLTPPQLNDAADATVTTIN